MGEIDVVEPLTRRIDRLAATGTSAWRSIPELHVWIIANTSDTETVALSVAAQRSQDIRSETVTDASHDTTASVHAREG
ncbi:hypothetical protein GCM10022240_29690 [Microbacterium kribbense]|uniref:Uncharacterized protein n=1 Tax=Microbacterium kribbense TaxID=433645 RepID=A0ABP7GW56_9MICO